MNFLAHLYWSDDTPLAMVGSLMPDLVRGRLPTDLPAEVWSGVRQHRRLDALTDTSPICHLGRQRLRAGHGRLAGILLDVFLDHVLACDWRQHHGQDLPDFVAHAYRRLHDGRPAMPVLMADAVERMTREDWLNGYAQFDGMERTLRRMSLRLEQRLGMRLDVPMAMQDLQAQRPLLTAELREYFDLLRQLDPPLRGGPALSPASPASVDA